MELLKGLNTQQQKAVMHTEGPLLLLAGAGSGKTRAITHRIAWLIKEKNVRPYNILAVTFTNKAASEMKQRIRDLVGEESRDIRVGTFHSMCMRILRQNIDRLGFDKNFVIFDTSDQRSLMRECLKELNIDSKLFPEKVVLYEIGRAKDELLEPDVFKKMHESDFRMDKIADLYMQYQKKLRQNNALDFDDIIIFTITLFVDNPSILSYYQQKFRYIHVDEYQDTNTAQYHLISLIARGHRNLCVVGDDDQSIYSFRGANIQNILNFEKEFTDCKVIKLEQNYRSTQTILDAANSMIKNNTGRKGKKLWTGNSKGCGIRCMQVENEHDEAAAVASEVRKLISEEGFKYKDLAVLYRTNAQSRVIEDIFRIQGIPYKILAGLSFYQRKEIKDVMAYLRVVHNPSNNVDLKRIINVPKRGIGKTTVDKMEGIAGEEGLSIFNVISKAENHAELKRAAGKLRQFFEMMNDLREQSRNMKTSQLIEVIIDKTGMIEKLEDQNTFESRSRIENIKELVSAALEFEKNPEFHGTLEEFLQSVSLASETDDIDDENSVLMLTLHSAKGLEFPVVFMVGMEEGLFPGYRSMENESGLEEERRLCYVGITRAQKTLYISNSRCRTLYGKTDYNTPSRFLKEIPENLMENILEQNQVEQKTFFKKDRPTARSNFGGTLYRGSTQISIEDIINNKQSAGSFSMGDRVRHKKFGVGTITKVTSENDDYKLEVKFDGSGLKRLMASYANLKKVD